MSDGDRSAETRRPGPAGALFSTANIGLSQVIPGMLKSREFEVRAIAPRELASAQKAATSLGTSPTVPSADAARA